MSVISLRFQSTNLSVLLLFGIGCHRWKTDICPPMFKEDQIFLFRNFGCLVLPVIQSARTTLPSVASAYTNERTREDHCLHRIHKHRDVCSTLGLPQPSVLEGKGSHFSNLAWKALKHMYLAAISELIYWKRRKTMLPSSRQLGKIAISETFQPKHLREVAKLVHALAKSAVLLSQLMAADLDWPQILQLPHHTVTVILCYCTWSFTKVSTPSRLVTTTLWA